MPQFKANCVEHFRPNLIEDYEMFTLLETFQSFQIISNIALSYRQKNNDSIINDEKIPMHRFDFIHLQFLNLFRNNYIDIFY